MVDRINVGRLAELYLAGRMSFADFMQAAPEDSQDEEIAELIDLIEHEPQRGGFLGRLSHFDPREDLKYCS